MRLTLRTLLAYLDDILDPADKEELAKKIESSEFAEDLIHRTRDTMRRLRLSAPQVVGTGMGLDPNTVAEYLDNALPPDSMGDFERICLESDMHLAEVASSHHVLTMVLGEPADVDPAAKQRMYALPAELAARKRLRVEAAHSQAAGSVISEAPLTVGAALANVAAAPASRPEVPEYLRASGLSRYRGLLIGLAALALVGATLYLLYGNRGPAANGPVQTARVNQNVAFAPPVAAPAANQFEAADQGLAMGESGPTESMPGDRGEAAAEMGSAPVYTPPGEYGAEPTLPSLPVGDNRYPDTGAPVAQLAEPQLADPQRLPPTNADPVDTATPSVEPDRYAVPATEQIAGSGDASITGTVAPTFPSLDVGAAPAEGVATPDGSARGTQPAGTASDDSRTAASAAGVLTPPVGVDVRDPAMDDPAAAAVADATGEMPVAEGAGTDDAGVAAEEAAPPVKDVGTYLGGKTVLLRFNGDEGTWYRMAPRSAVEIGDRVLALPEFRPKVSVISGLHLDVVGGTMLAIGGPAAGAADALSAAAAVPTIDVLYGRLVVINTSNTEQAVSLILGPTKAEARLARNATLAVEVERRHVPGNDPRKAPSPVLARLYAPDGGVVWHDAAGVVTVEKPSEWAIADGVPTEITASATQPEWIDQQTELLSSEQRYGAPVLESSLTTDRPVGMQLLELYEDDRTRREVKSLVTRSSIHVGQFKPFVAALRDSKQRPNWQTHIALLRSAMAQSPESAELVRQTLVDQRGEPAASAMYEMLCGYSDEQVGRTPDQQKTGAMSRLISWLDEDSLDYRVLAVNGLLDITGKQLMPNPAGSLQERSQNIRRWRTRLESGELKPLEQSAATEQ